MSHCTVALAAAVICCCAAIQAPTAATRIVDVRRALIEAGSGAKTTAGCPFAPAAPLTCGQYVFDDLACYQAAPVARYDKLQLTNFWVLNTKSLDWPPAYLVSHAAASKPSVLAVLGRGSDAAAADHEGGPVGNLTVVDGGAMALLALHLAVVVAREDTNTPGLEYGNEVVVTAFLGEERVWTSPVYEVYADAASNVEVVPEEGWTVFTTLQLRTLGPARNARAGVGDLTMDNFFAVCLPKDALRKEGSGGRAPKAVPAPARSPMAALPADSTTALAGTSPAAAAALPTARASPAQLGGLPAADASPVVPSGQPPHSRGPDVPATAAKPALPSSVPAATQDGQAVSGAEREESRDEMAGGAAGAWGPPEALAGPADEGGAAQTESQIFGDPHMVAFDGTRFEFMGFSGGTFNVMSERRHLVNMLLDEFGFQGSTFIKAIGLRYANSSTVTITATEEGSRDQLHVTVNGARLRLSGGLGNSRMEHVTKDGIAVAVQRHGDGSEDVRVATPALRVQVERNAHAQHLDMRLSLLLPNMEAAHGVLGQTIRWRRGNARFEGDLETDYLVSGLLDWDFKYNRYDPAADPAKAARRRNARERDEGEAVAMALICSWRGVVSSHEAA